MGPRLPSPGLHRPSVSRPRMAAIAPSPSPRSLNIRECSANHQPMHPAPTTRKDSMLTTDS